MAPCEQDLQARLENRYHLPGSVEVVHSVLTPDVAFHGAHMLLKLVQDHHRKHPQAEAVHVGMAGGMTLRELARTFAELLRVSASNLPRRIEFHGMVAGFNVNNPATDPNSFMAYFVNDPLQVEVGFVGLHAPGIVELDEFAGLRRNKMVNRAYVERDKLDIIVMSAGRWKDGHSSLRKFLRLEEIPEDALANSRCIGDMMWRPLAADGPMGDEFPVRAATLMELADVADFVKRGGDSLLVLGPCGACRQPKTEILESILGLKDRLVTHLVVDSRSASGLFRDDPGQGPGLPPKKATGKPR